MHAVRRQLDRDGLAGRGGGSRAALGALAASIMLGTLPYAARSDWVWGTGAGVRHDDNVGNAESRSDIVGDSAIDGRLSTFQLYPLDGSYSVSVGGDLSGEAYRRLTGLNEVTLDGAIALKRKWGLGAFAPWARVGVSLGRSSYEDSYRNSWDYGATLASGRRIDERWNVWVDYAFERRAASTQMREVPALSGNAYSQNSHTAAVHVEYSLNESTFLAIGVLGRHGDVVSTGAGSAKIYYASRALAEDPAFGPEAYAYRLTGTTYGFQLGIGYASTAHSVIGLGFKHFDTHADGGNSYIKSVAEITWDYRR
jgi:hypothetical protein